MDVRISSIGGNRQRLDGGAMFGNAPRAVWEKWCVPDERGRIELACRAMLVESGKHKILCETGIGCFFDPKLADRYGVVESTHKLLENLTTAGIKPEEITAVVLSHLHFDHAGGLLPSYAEIQAGRGDLVFPNAEFFVGQTAWDRALHPHPRDRASFIPGLSDKILATGRLRLIPDGSKDHYLDGLLSFHFTSGHTPGQMHAVVHGKHHKIIFAGDLVPGTAWVHVPITMGYDRFAEQVIDEKQSLYSQIATPDWMVFFTHDAEVCAARIEDAGNGKFVAQDRVPRPMRRLSI